MVENGNSVGLTVTSPPPALGEPAVESIHVFAEGNPLPNVLQVRFGPRAGRIRVATRIRLATSQTVTAVARLSDGTWRADSVDPAGHAGGVPGIGTHHHGPRAG